MKNVELLPVSEEIKNRLVKFAKMHRMYGGPEIDVGTVVENSVLILITYEGEHFTQETLIEAATDMFEGEIEGANLYYAVNTPYQKHIPTYDGRYIFRIDNGIFKAIIRRDDKTGNVVAGGASYRVQIIQGDSNEYLLSQLEKWVQTSITRDNMVYDETPDIDLNEIRHLEDVLEELFTSSRMSDEVRAYRTKYQRSELGLSGAIKVAEEFTPYKCIVVCLPKAAPN
ncbi:MAG: hypothetical protein KTR29_21190 [Rhodothermaceae bacterium]|nr:hypothetical protein [Rhodothermaceae bacterium]